MLGPRMTPRLLRPVDLLLYTLVMSLAVRWPAGTAGAGPIAPFLWAAAMAGFMVPLVCVTAELVTRYPGSGGLYDWTREAFGPFAGFVCGWLYWTCNLPFFSGLLVFTVAAAGSAAGGPVQAALATTPGYLGASVALAVVVAWAHLRGLGVGKWLSNIGGLGTVALLGFMIAGGAAVALLRGSATDFAHASYALPLNANGAILWSTMVLGFGGPEAAAFLKDEVQGGVRTVMKVLAVVGLTQVAVYSLATLGLLAILPAEQMSHLGGLPDALQACARRLGLPALGPALVAVVVATSIGGYAAWFGLAARVPFAIGVGDALPRAFARRDPKTGAPVAALQVQLVVVVVLLLLGAAGSNLKAAYDFLVAMTVISYILPFGFMFAAHLKLGAPAASDTAVWRIPGGRPARVGLSVLGLVTTASAVLASLAPSPDATDKVGAVVKLLVATAVLVLAGVASYALSRRLRAQPEPAT